MAGEAACIFKPLEGVCLFSKPPRHIIDRLLAMNIAVRYGLPVRKNFIQTPRMFLFFFGPQEVSN
jgi:hypothetical protein